MNREKTFRRRFAQGLNGLKTTAGQIEETVMDQAEALAEQTRKGWKRSRKAVSSWEDKMEDSIRDHPLLYLGGAMAVIGLLIAKMIFDRSQR